LRDSKNEVIKFWFEEIKPQQWFQKNAAFDADISDRFMTTYEMAKKNLCSSWTNDADGVLALSIVLDQLPRNMFRDKPKAFETDYKILGIVKEALHKGLDQILPHTKRRFIYMPFMHSEELNDQKICVELFKKIKIDDPLSYEYALKHLEVIEKFGRFPHRNEILGRQSSKDELSYMKLPGAGF